MEFFRRVQLRYIQNFHFVTCSEVSFPYMSPGISFAFAAYAFGECSLPSAVVLANTFLIC